MSLIISCSNIQQELLIVDMENHLGEADKQIELQIDQIAANVEYISLETSDSCLLKDLYIVRETTKYFLL